MLINHVNNHHTEPRAMRQAPQNSAQKQLFEVLYGALLRGNLYKSYCFKKNFIQKNIPDSSAVGEGTGVGLLATRTMFFADSRLFSKASIPCCAASYNAL